MSEEIKAGVSAPEDEVLSKMPAFPDGVGISLEDMNVLLAQKNDSVMDPHDPALVMVSICNAFLGEIQKLHERHNEALSRIIVSRTEEYVLAVKETSETFSQAVSEASVEGIRKIFGQQAAALQASIWNARWCALIAAVAALVNLYALIGGK